MRTLSLIFSLMVLTFFVSQIWASPDVSELGIAATKNWAKRRVELTQESFSREQGVYKSSPGFWGSQIIYQIQVDRFNNGDASNDDKNILAPQRQHQATENWYGLPDYRHGGDLQGIIKRLDYIKDLGVTTLWLTPFLKHDGGYHGYCSADLTQVDPGFGSNEDFRQLVKEAHKRDIYVVMDVVINHLCDIKTKYKVNPDHYACSEDLAGRNWSGTPGASDKAGQLEFSEDFFGPLKSPHFFNRCGPNSIADMQGTGAPAVYGDFVAGMFDYDTRNHDFQQLFTDLYKYWIAYADVDGFRLDAAKHITEDFVAYFSTQVRDYARGLGKDKFLIVGEVAGPSDWIGRRLGKMFSNPNNPGDHGHIPQTLTSRMYQLKDIYLNNPLAPYPGLDAAYDFTHGGIARDVMLGVKGSTELESHFTSQYFNDLAHQNDYRLNWNLLEIHDWPRFAAGLKSPEKSILGISYLALAEGAPIIYYGMEQGFNSDCHYDNMNAGAANDSIKQDCHSHSHAVYRQDMFAQGPYRLGSVVPEINALAYIGRTDQDLQEDQRDPFLNQTHTLYKTARKMLAIRKSCQPLMFGSTQFLWSTPGPGLLAFARVDQGKRVIAVLNTSYSEFELPKIPVPGLDPGQKWVNLLNPSEAGFVDDQGQLDFKGLHIKGNSTMVFAYHDAITGFDSYLETHLCR